MVKLSTSSGSILLISRSGTPSTINNGDCGELAKVATPRTNKFAPPEPGPPERCVATTPAKRPAMAVERLATGTFNSSRLIVA